MSEQMDTTEATSPPDASDTQELSDSTSSRPQSATADGMSVMSTNTNASNETDDNLTKEKTTVTTTPKYEDHVQQVEQAQNRKREHADNNKRDDKSTTKSRVSPAIELAGSTLAPGPQAVVGTRKDALKSKDQKPRIELAPSLARPSHDDNIPKTISPPSRPGVTENEQRVRDHLAKTDGKRKEKDRLELADSLHSPPNQEGKPQYVQDRQGATVPEVVHQSEAPQDGRLEWAEEHVDSRRGLIMLTAEGDLLPRSERSSGQPRGPDDGSHLGYAPPNRDNVSVVGPTWGPPTREYDDSVGAAPATYPGRGTLPTILGAFLAPGQPSSTIEGTGSRGDEDTLKSDDRAQLKFLNRMIVICLLVLVCTAIAVGLTLGLRPSNAQSIPAPRSQNPTSSPTESMSPSVTPSLAPTKQFWKLENVYNGSNPADQFGSTVDVKGDILAISSPGYRNGTGLVRVSNVATGAQVGQDLVGTSLTERFGHRMVLSIDSSRTRLAVLSLGVNSSGAVHIYDYGMNQTWTELVVIDRSFIEAAGLNTSEMTVITDIAFSGNGKVLAISANNIFVFSYSFELNTWVPLGKDTIPQSVNANLALSRDGGFVVVATSLFRDTGVYQYNSAVDVWLKYRNERGRNSFQQEDNLEVLKPNGGVAMSEDGNLFVVGDKVGVVEVFIIDFELAEWRPIGNALAPVPQAFEMSVEIPMGVSISGNAVAIAYQNISEAGINASLYVLNEKSWEPQGETVELTQEGVGSNPSVSLTGGGNRMAIGLQSIGSGLVGVYGL